MKVQVPPPLQAITQHSVLGFFVYKRIEIVQMSDVSEKTEQSEGNCLHQIPKRDHASNPHLNIIRASNSH